MMIKAAYKNLKTCVLERMSAQREDVFVKNGSKVVKNESKIGQNVSKISKKSVKNGDF